MASMGTTFEISKAISSLRSTSEWSLSGEEYSGLVWINVGVKPTEQEILDEIALQ